MTVQIDANLREALDEFRSYLSDLLAPMMVTDSMERLLTSPPELVAREIQHWIGGQITAPGQPVIAADYIHHAIKKIHLMAEFDLIEVERMRRYLEELGRLVIADCPEHDRESLIANLNRLGEDESGAVGQVRVLYGRAGGSAGVADAAPPASAGGPAPVGAAPASMPRAPNASAAPSAASPAAASPAAPVAPAAPAATSNGATAAPPPAVILAGDPAVVTAEVMRGMRRFSALVDRLERTEKPVARDDPAREQVLTQALASAAFSARSETELSEHMERLAGLGLDARIEEIFRKLGGILPGWAVPEEVAALDGEATPPGMRPVEAMRRLVTMAPNGAESGKRFNELVATGVEQFNDGNLAQARTIFELARRLVEEGAVPADTADAVRRQAHLNLSQNYLRRFADGPDRRALLRTVLDFFPAFSPTSLLDELYEEPKRDRRKLLLLLLETHGAAARRESWQRLREWGEDDERDPHGYYFRNLVYLLRRILCDDEVDRGAEAEFLTQIGDWGRPAMLVREVVSAASQFDRDRAESFLIPKLDELETALIENACEPYSADEVGNLLDRTVSSLIRCGSPSALRCVVEHGFRSEPQLGDTHGRLREVGTQNLSGDGSLVSRLLDELEKLLPVKVLGFVMQRQNEKISELIHALSGTPTAEVKELFEEICERFPEQSFERDAAKALAAFGVETKSDDQVAASLSGDIELFGLPNLLQSLADSKVAGVLTLTDRDANEIGRLWFDDGALVGCRAGGLRGEVAFYQLFETPVPGNFAFKRRRDAAEDGRRGEPIEVMPAILEAMRRYDEFQQARVLVPDDAKYEWSGEKPSRPYDEPDPAFTKSVWVMAAKGATPVECETALESDSYRVRRLFAHWVENGAIMPA